MNTGTNTAAAQSYTNPIDLVEVDVLWKGERGNFTLEPEDGGYLDKPNDKGHFLLVVTTYGDQKVILSDPFVDKFGEIIYIEGDGRYDNESTCRYSKKVGIAFSQNGRNRSYFTKKPHNSIHIAAVEGNRLTIIVFGVASQGNNFYFVKKVRYTAELFQKDGEIVALGLEQWASLPEVLEDSDVDASDLPELIGHVDDSDEDAMQMPVGLNKGRVIWCDPFANQIALETDRGNALCPYKFISNLHDQRTLIDLVPGTIVKVGRLEAPAAESNTTFPWIAKDVTV